MSELSASLVLPQALAEELERVARLPVETAGVIFASVVHAENGATRVLGRSVRWIDDAQYIRRGGDHMSIASEGYVPFLGEAERLAALPIWVHTHPGEESL